MVVQRPVAWSVRHVPAMCREVLSPERGSKETAERSRLLACRKIERRAVMS